MSTRATGATGDPAGVAIYLYEPSDGGLDRVAILLANELATSGIAVELWLTRTEGPLASLIDPAVPIQRVAAPASRSRRVSMIGQFPALHRMVRSRRPAILYSAGNQSNLLVALACRCTATQAVGRISNPIVRPHDDALTAGLRRLRFAVSTRLSALTIVMGEADRAQLAPSGPVTLLPRPTLTPALTAVGAHRAPRNTASPLTFLAVGRLHPQKDYATMLAALARLDHLDWRLRIVGQGPLEAELRANATALGIADRVDFLGFVKDPAAIANLYRDADLFLQSSRWEGLSGAIIEALGTGCETVVTNSTANMVNLRQAADQQPPVPIGDSDAFANAIRNALAEPASIAAMTAAASVHRFDTAVAAYRSAFVQLGGKAALQAAAVR